MPKFKVYVNDSLKWTGTARTKEAAIHAAAIKAGQVWNVRFDTPLDEEDKDYPRIFLHTDKERPDMIVNIKPLDVVPLIHDSTPRLKPGRSFVPLPIGEFMARASTRGPVKTFGKE